MGGPCAERMWNLTRGNVLFLNHLVTQELHAERLINRNDHWRWEGTMQVSQSLVDLMDSRMGATCDPVLDVVDLVAVAGTAGSSSIWSRWLIPSQLRRPKPEA